MYYLLSPPSLIAIASERCSLFRCFVVRIVFYRKFRRDPAPTIKNRKSTFKGIHDILFVSRRDGGEYFLIYNIMLFGFREIKNELSAAPEGGVLDFKRITEE